MSTIMDVLGQKIKNIYYSPNCSRKFGNSIFIDLENSTRFRFTYNGPTYSLVTSINEDLFKINFSEDIEELFVGKEIVELQEYDKFFHRNHAIITLNNKVQIFVDNFGEDIVSIGSHEWSPTVSFLANGIKAPDLPMEQRKYEKIVSYFVGNIFGSNLAVLSHLSMLNPKDRIEIINRVMDNGTNNLYIYDKLSMAYAKNGQLFFGVNILNIGSINGIIDDFNFETMNIKIASMAKTIPFDITTQLNYIVENKKLATTTEFDFLNILEEFIKKNYI